MKKFSTVDEYLAAQPKDARERLRTLRAVIRRAAPQAGEVISYNIPAFEWNGKLVWYAGFKNHIGLYPKTSAIEAFKQDLKGYKTSKGAIQFPIEEPIPEALVQAIVRFRVSENRQARRPKRKTP